MRGTQFKAYLFQTVYQIPRPFLIIVDYGQKKARHEQKHNEMLEYIPHLFPIQRRFDSQEAYLKNQQPTEHKQSVFFQNRFPSRSFVIKGRHQL